MEAHFNKLIKVIESCENTKQFNAKFLAWVNNSFFAMAYRLENFEQKQHLLQEAIINKSNEICQN
jgi:ferric iron reductase protein FhuF